MLKYVFLLYTTCALGLCLMFGKSLQTEVSQFGLYSLANPLIKKFTGKPKFQLQRVLRFCSLLCNLKSINVLAETKDPQKSRVIIFSNFRGSVR